ncbi:MAG: DUF4013 domain-containing protein, partial [Chloroflexi bacterium]
ALERAAGLLERGGGRAVFTARLIPGLRVHTTEVAGVSRISRLTFISGLLPATAVYLAAFIGLGAAIGRPILALIGQAEHQVLVAIVLLAVVVAVVLLTRAPVRRGLASLYAAGWSPFRLRLDSISLILILAALGLNFSGHALAIGLKLPLFLDSTGTVLAGIVGGPWVGGSVGLISNLVSSNTIDPIAAPYGIVSFAVGFAAGLTRYLNWHKRPMGWVALWLLCFAIAAMASTPLNFLFNNGATSVGFGDAIDASLTSFHLPTLLAAFLGEAAVDLPDKFITVVAALLIAQGIAQPQRTTSPAEFDLSEAFTFVVRSHGWVRKLGAAALCVLFSWLVVPYLLLSGYLIDLARSRRADHRDLPAWNRPWPRIKDGFKINLVLLLWALPSLVLSIPATIVASARGQSSLISSDPVSDLAAILAAIGSIWILVVLLFEPAIFSEYLDRGLVGALNLWRVGRRLRRNLTLSIVVGALVIVLTVLGLIGLAGVLIGALITLPYAGFVGAYLVGYYAKVTGRQVDAGAFPEPARV